ncbi:MAG: IS630 family transposase, partial [Opitutales bacterium]
MFAKEQKRPDVVERRKQWKEQMKDWSGPQLVFIDESGINTKMARLYGRSLGSERCVDHVPYGHWHTNTFIAALRHDRLTAPMLLDGPMNSDTFLEYVTSTLIPTLKPGDIVICDNLSSHKNKAVAEALKQVGARIEYLPAYSPDLNVILRVKVHHSFAGQSAP